MLASGASTVRGLAGFVVVHLVITLASALASALALVPVVTTCPIPRGTPVVMSNATIVAVAVAPLCTRAAVFVFGTATAIHPALLA